ncbi:hypothetical protein WDH52_01010 [Streptomyces sp. TRM70308]|uniref:hypothetical protein n=1 Tax=Streptomyces sp. TRM70308 TaxID=3131932 RepID=UPI003D0773D3
MRGTSKTAVAAAVAVATAALTACGGGSGAGSDDAGGGPGQRADQRAGAGGPEAPELAVPEEFDNTGGWGVPASEGAEQFAVAPHAGALLFARVTGHGEPVTVHARDLATGAPLWQGEPVERLPGEKPLTEGRALHVTSKGEEDYAVLLTSGTEGADGVNKGSGVTRLHVYAVDASGTGAPERVIEVPGETGAGGYRVQPTDGLVYLPGAGAVDVSTGTTREVPAAERKAPADAEGCRAGFSDCDANPSVMAVTADGPLVNGADMFWRGGPGGWSSADAAVRPGELTDEHDSARVLAYLNGRAVVQWEAEWEGPGANVVSLHDGADGAVEASVTCAQEWLPGSTREDVTGPRLSADGRYLHLDTVLFDLERGEGHCFGPTEERRSVTLTAVDAARGTAYGFSPPTGHFEPQTPARVALADGAAEALPEGVLLPEYVDGDVALFDVDSATEGGDGFDVVVYARR